MSYARACYDAACEALSHLWCTCVNPMSTCPFHSRVKELSDRLQNTVECYLQDIEQEDREAEQRRKDRDEALLEAAGEARQEALREEREAGRG